jgi:hypothetical protein
MTTFTTQDREEVEKEWEGKKEPIPFAGMVDIDLELSKDEKKIEVSKTFNFD